MQGPCRALGADVSNLDFMLRVAGASQKAIIKFVFFLINLSIIYLFIFGCIASLLLLCAGFLSCGKRGLLFVEVGGLLIAVASLVAEHGL